MKSETRVVTIVDTFSTDDLEIPQGSSLIVEKIHPTHFECTWPCMGGTYSKVFVAKKDCKQQP